MYVKYNTEGNIEALSRTEQAGFIWVDAQAPELATFLSELKSPLQQSLEQSDQSLVRVLEDLVNVLIAKGVIRFTDLPDAAQDKLLTRKQLRTQQQAVYVLDDEEGFKL